MVFHLSRRQHLQVAALLWTLVGAMLVVRGLLWIRHDQHTHWLFAAILPLAAVAGVAKGAAVLRKSAACSAARIHLLAERTPFWHIYSPATYLLVVGMMALGFACRWAGAYWNIMGYVGILYLVIGIGLITGSCAYWQARKAIIVSDQNSVG